jgi:hypothetical protein
MLLRFEKKQVPGDRSDVPNLNFMPRPGFADLVYFSFECMRSY